jgi:hypothetical protein
MNHISEAEMRQWAADGKTWAALAKAIGRSKSHVYAAASLLGIPSASYGGTYPKRVKRAPVRDAVTANAERYWQMRQSGMTYSQIAKEVGRLAATVYATLARRGRINPSVVTRNEATSGSTDQGSRYGEASPTQDVHRDVLRSPG